MPKQMQFMTAETLMVFAESLTGRDVAVHSDCALINDNAWESSPQ